MFFLLEKEMKRPISEIEVFIVRDILEHNRILHDYQFRTVEDFSEDVVYPSKFRIKEVVPVGSIDYVSAYLKTIHGIENMNPIEIPNCLRTNEFLKREYAIVKKNDIPEHGVYFIKDVSRLKKFAYAGELKNLSWDRIWDKEDKTLELHLDNDHLYQLSEYLDILSEYRIYFISGELQAVSHYNGNPWLFPDMNLIKKANLIYSMQKDYPKSYTMDVAITKRGTCLLEIHPFACVGLYNSLWGSNILYAYRDGIDYYLYHNTKLKEG